MTRQPRDGTQKNDVKGQDESFAKLLGERWHTTGDGIYRLVDDTVESAEDAAPEDELGDAAEPSPQEDDQRESEQPGRRRRWLKR
jgi:hypothetical protein